MADLAEKLLSTPTGTLLVIAGILFLLIAVVGNITGKIEPGPQGRVVSGVVGALLLIGGLTVFANKPSLDPNPPEPHPVPKNHLEPLKLTQGAVSTSNGAIAARYRAMGGEAGSLGAPLTGEEPAANGGFYTDYRNGFSIYWTKETGAHIMHGAIKSKWLAAGGPNSALGYPTTDETWNGVGFQQNFKHCFMVWTEAGGVKITPE